MSAHIVCEKRFEANFVMKLFEPRARTTLELDTVNDQVKEEERRGEKRYRELHRERAERGRKEARERGEREGDKGKERERIRDEKEGEKRKDRNKKKRLKKEKEEVEDTE
jgi:hypothetical protein